MNIYENRPIGDILRDNEYVGRGIVIGTSEDGRYAACAYFIMGRSENSRNRIFVAENGTVRTEPFDAARDSDPSLIIYNAVLPCPVGSGLIVTNGDQTDTVCRGMKEGLDFRSALEKRAFEPDAPNFTPRISGILHFDGGSFRYEMSILKSIDAEGSDCCRYHFAYPKKNGTGHFLHTYLCNGDPLPTFCGEPERIAVPNDIDALCTAIWDNLNRENRISLYVRYTDLSDGTYTERLINRNR